MSFNTSIESILGIWKKENTPPYQIDNKEIQLNLKNANSLSIVTIKENDNYIEFLLKTISIDENSTGEISIKYKIVNGLNINEKFIGSEMVLKCNMFLGFPKVETMVCESSHFSRCLFNRIEY